MRGQTRTINLTRVSEGNHYENILRRKFTYDEEVRRRVALKREFLEQKRLADELHHQRSLAVVADTIEEVKSFVTKALDLKGTNLFEKTGDQIHGEILYLDMHISDHETTLGMVERAVKKLVSNLHVVRLKTSVVRKRSIPDLMEASKQSKRVLVIVEEAECLNRRLADSLVGHLKNRLADETSPTEAVMVLFCLSIKIQTLPIDTMHCFGRMRGIVKHTDETSKTRVHELLRSRNLKVKLAPEVLDFINIHSLNADSSTTNINFLHCYSIFEHYANLEEDELLGAKEFLKLESNHQSLCDDIQCLSKFLYERDKFPEDVTDLYEELGVRQNLSQSEKFFNAVQDIKKIPHDRLLKRFQRLEDELDSLAKQKKPKSSALSLLLSYREKIANNKDCNEVLSEFVSDIMTYARGLSCPCDEQTNFYFDDRRALMRGCFTSSRALAELSDYLDTNSHFGVLLSKVLSSMGQVDTADLCDEVIPEFKKLIIRTKSEDASKPEPAEPSPPKRSRRRTTIRATQKCDERVGVAKEDIDGLARAIFVDMIDSMEHQGLIKIDARTKGGKVIRRLAWPVTTKCD